MVDPTTTTTTPTPSLSRRTIQPLSALPDKGDPFHFQKLSDVEVKPINWLWKPYIPRGALSLIIGDGGYGKSWLTCAIAADLSQGRPLPGQEPLPPQKVLMISAEDDLSQVIKPKMIMLDADMAMIKASDRGFTLDAKAMVHLVRHIKEYDVAIVFLDPLVVYLGGKMDMHRANEARAALTQLSEVAQETQTAIVAVHHVRKSGEGVAQHKVMGSADFVNGVRSAMLVDVSKGGQRFMAHVKSNWAANGPTLAYQFGKQGFQWQGEYGDVGKPAPEISRTRRGEVQEWIKDRLKAGPQLAGDMLAMAEEANFSEKTLLRAKKGIVRSFNEQGKWFWALEAPLVKAEVPEGMTQEDMDRQALVNMGLLSGGTVVLTPEVSEELANAKRVMAEKARG